MNVCHRDKWRKDVSRSVLRLPGTFEGLSALRRALGCLTVALDKMTS